MSNISRTYRFVVFVLVLFYWVYMTFLTHWGGFGGPYRYLTIWGLALAFISGIHALRLGFGRSQEKWDAFISAAAVVNAMVVFLYWKLYFDDPASVTRNGELGVWWREYYLHLLGPVLLWIDALFINRVFQRLLAALGWLAGLIIGYLVWVELLVGPLNDSPVGTVTSGMPYPFMNNMELSQRAVFYASNLVVAVIFLAGFAALAWLIRRLLPSQSTQS